jgi:D-galactose 1-dehydrogenase
MRTPTLGLVGLGKISVDQHLPSIAETGLFTLAAVVSPRGPARGDVPTFRSQAEMLAALPDLDAVAICTPPSVRHDLAAAALAAGKHVLVEKPPTATVSELVDLEERARQAGRTLFTAWHSQFNPAVEAAADLLAGTDILRVEVIWREDVRRWHPGQDWVWAPGGFGVFDPGINALSILSRVLPVPILVTRAELLYPSDRQTPIAASIGFRTVGQRATDRVTADFDWRQEGEQTWTIAIETEGGPRVALARGGTRLAVDGKVAVDEPDAEYRRIYRRFRELVATGASQVDAVPLRLVADAFMLGRRETVEAFHW